MANPSNSGSYSKTDVDALLSKAIVVKTYVKDNITMPAGRLSQISFEGTNLSGYNPVAMWESFSNATSSGVNSSYCFTYNRQFYSSSATLMLRNFESSDACIKATVTIVYVKDDLCDASGYSN